MKKSSRFLFFLTTVVLTVSMLTTITPIASAATYNYLFPVKNGKIAYGYGYPPGYGGFHDALDIHASTDDTIYAAYSGVVTETGNLCWHVDYGAPCGHPYGNYIRISQDDGTVVNYVHLAQNSILVSPGTRVNKGQAIARMGSSGYSTGKHLHFEVLVNGTKINVNPVSDGGLVNYSYTGYGDSPPRGCVDSYNSGDNSFTIRGWAFDPDTLDTKVTLHIHVNGVHTYAGQTGILRTDVNDYYGCGNNQGFEITVPYEVSQATECTVSVYALSTADANNYISLGSGTVTIYPQSNPSTPPPSSSINYHSVKPINYCILNVGTKKYLTVDDGIDQNNQNVSVHSFCNSWAYKIAVTKVQDDYTYKLQPLCGLRIINPANTVASGTNVNIYDDVNDSSQWWKFEVYGTAYIIRNAQNPNCVLATNGENVIVETFTGNANQQWTLHPTLDTIYYDANGGIGAPDSQIKEHGVDLILNSQIPSRNGYNFVGWSHSSTATTADYMAGGIYSHWAGGTLYAVWSKNSSHTCTFSSYIYNNDASAYVDGTKTRTCSICGKSETITATGTKWINPFTDVKKSDFYYAPVLWAVNNGITSGTSKTAFSPNEACTRGQIATFLWRAAGCPNPKTSKNPFTDVKKSDYYYKAVLWAVGEGITSGATKTNFQPDAPCTRGQIATFLWRSAGAPTSKTSKNPFTDVKKKDYYYKAVLWAVGEGITAGTTKTTFGPNEACTRGQIATFLYRAYN